MRPLARALAAVVVSVASLWLAAAPATASPAMPRPLERKIADADLVVVAKVRTKPAHPGDVFEIDVETCLKGDAGSGPLRVSAAHFFTGCMPAPEGTPLPPSIEGRGARALLFLDAAEDGVRMSRDPVVLAPGETSSAWFYDDRPAEDAPKAVAALVELDREDDAAQAVALWAEGLARAEPLLVTALLHRLDFVATGGDWAKGQLGETLAARARVQFATGRAKLVEAVARCAASDDAVIRMLVFRVALNCVAGRTDAEKASFERITAAARAAADADDHAGGAARAYLCATADETAVAHLVLAMRRGGPGAVPDHANLGRFLVSKDAAKEEALGAALVPLVEDPEQGVKAVRFLALLTGKELGDAAACREWWKAKRR